MWRRSATRRTGCGDLCTSFSAFARNPLFLDREIRNRIAFAPPPMVVLRYTKFKQGKTDLKVLFEHEAGLFNPYGVIAVNRFSHLQG